MAISYKVLEAGTPVHASGGEPIGTVSQVLDNAREEIFDGIVVDTPAGARFVDAPEVSRIAERRVTLTLDAEAAAGLPEPDSGAPELGANTKPGRLGRLWRKKR